MNFLLVEMRLAFKYKFQTRFFKINQALLPKWADVINFMKTA